MAYKEFNDINILQKEIAYQRSDKNKGLVITFITGHFDSAYHSVLREMKTDNDMSLVIQVRGDSVGQSDHHLDPLNHDDKELLIRQNINYFCIYEMTIQNSFQIINNKSLDLFGLSSEKLSCFLKTAMSSLQYFGATRIVFLERYARQYFALRELLNELHIPIEVTLVKEDFAENSLRYFNEYEYISSNYSDEIALLSASLNSVVKNCRGLSKELINNRIVESLEDEGFSKVSCSVYDPVNPDNEFISKSSRFYLTLEIGGRLYVDDRSLII